MASRRKSARPTNKVQQQVEEDDEDDNGDTESALVLTLPTKHVSLTTARVHLTPHGHNKGSCFGASIPRAQGSPSCEAQEPYIAIPSDIYEDFEALKSATKLDTPDLMRKLLKDYHRLATSPTHLLRERRLDGVIGDIVAAKTSSALDLSRSNHSVTNVSDKNRDGAHVRSSPNYSLAEQQCVEDDLSEEEEEGELKPLDLTLNRHEPAVSPDSAIVEDIHMKSSKSALSFVNQSLETYQSLSPQKHTGSYVINLEPGSEGSITSNSMLAKVLQLDIPPKNVHKIQNYSIGSPSTLFSQANRKNQAYSQTSALFLNDTNKVEEDKSDIKSIPFARNENNLRLSGLPSYSEALSSVLHSQTISTRLTECESTKESLTDASGVKKELLNRGLSVFQTSLGESDISQSQRKLPFGLNLPHVDTTHRILHQHFMQQQLLKSELQHQNIANEVQQSRPVSGPQMSMKMLSAQSPVIEAVDCNGDKHSLKASDLSFPNFLLDPQSLGIQPSTTAMSNGAVASTASIQMPAFFMTTPTSCMNGVVAVLHSLPEGVTGLQPFAFAPHPVQQSSISSSSIPAQLSTEMNFTTANTTPATNFTSISASTTLSDQNAAIQAETTQPSPPLASARPKPGRPRGKGGRGKLQRIQNKDMKLLTENTLFPGVYTSILKLPWSRRSRNKSKSKTVLEVKKEAQIIAHEKVTEGESNFLCESEVHDLESASQEIEDVFDTLNQECKQEKQVDLKGLNEHTFENSMLYTQESSNEPPKLDHIQSIQRQKQKDLEQQQRLHAQYHQRLQEEQRKLTKQIEMSYLNMSSSPVQTLSINALNLPTLKQEAMSPDLCSPVSKLSSKSFTPDGEEQYPSNENVVMTFSTDDKKALTSKLPRKRGRPPKMHVLYSPLEKQTENTEITSSLIQSPHKAEIEPDNFLNVTTAATTSNFSILKSALSTMSSDGFAHRRAIEQFTTRPNLSSTLIEPDMEVQKSINKKLSFLTSQIELESPVAKHQPEDETTASSYLEYEDESTPDEQDAALINEITPEVKPRKKKVSRSLKSNENFMYATFKIKPKNVGLTPRKSRRKRKDVLASTAAAAETIANLRQRKLLDATLSDGLKPSSMIAWKFHEQYPHSSEENSEKIVAEKRTANLLNGDFSLIESPHNVLQTFETCLDVPRTGEKLQMQLNNELIDSELKAECCVTCGQIFQKHYSDTSARCNECIRNTSMIIKSSKLFSFGDFPTSSLTSVPPTSTLSSTLASKMETVLPRETGGSSLCSNNPNRLHCNTCQMDFTKICDYLQHIRESHGAPNVNQGETTRRVKVSKTKKSLAHKTLTCPVEDCPHFFRAQRDLETHFLKKHSSLGTCPHSDCSFTCTLREDLENHFRFDHDAVGSVHALSVPSTPESITENSADGMSVRTASLFSEKPLHCEFCDYRCRQKNALTWHMRKHPEAASQYKRYNSMNSD
ncbi:hypothetical protein Bpfe_006846 [Biomphalaria pfeifferi]|uniref:C2H2-type domain-containing protein n=1 Tax=Biomphalaria pfeifferi TaxID=112525 RepID=A0AAD8FGP1_BIOPF|nr:hypothetical protein Bpfe_006846 [Biomphalaria pfeifferi]